MDAQVLAGKIHAIKDGEGFGKLLDNENFTVGDLLAVIPVVSSWPNKVAKKRLHILFDGFFAFGCKPVEVEEDEDVHKAELNRFRSGIAFVDSIPEGCKYPLLKVTSETKYLIEYMGVNFVQGLLEEKGDAETIAKCFDAVVEHEVLGDEDGRLMASALNAFEMPDVFEAVEMKEALLRVVSDSHKENLIESHSEDTETFDAFWEALDNAQKELLRDFYPHDLYEAEVDIEVLGDDEVVVPEEFKDCIGGFEDDAIMASEGVGYGFEDEED